MIQILANLKRSRGPSLVAARGPVVRVESPDQQRVMHRAWLLGLLVALVPLACVGSERSALRRDSRFQRAKQLRAKREERAQADAAAAGGQLPASPPLGVHMVRGVLRPGVAVLGVFCC